MNPQVSNRKFGIAAALVTVWLFLHQLVAFILAVVIGTTSSSYKDEPATIIYLVLSAFGVLLGIASLTLSALNLMKDTKGKWLGIVSIIITLFCFAVTAVVAIWSAVDTWG